MNLWLRLLLTLLRAAFGPALRLPSEASRLRFRVWPHDLDPSLHMNNGRYLAIMDLGRLDMLVASGLWRPALRHHWTPIASTILIRFRRELRLFERYCLETRILCWSEDSVVMEQTFVHDGGPRAGQIAAHALFKGGLYDRAARAFIPVERLMQEIGVNAESAAPPPEVTGFLAAAEELKRAGATRSAETGG
jgi:acyl-CoA thioesterase FadM